MCSGSDVGVGGIDVSVAMGICVAVGAGGRVGMAVTVEVGDGVVEGASVQVRVGEGSARGGVVLAGRDSDSATTVVARTSALGNGFVLVTSFAPQLVAITPNTIIPINGRTGLLRCDLLAIASTSLMILPRHQSDAVQSWMVPSGITVRSHHHVLPMVPSVFAHDGVGCNICDAPGHHI